MARLERRKAACSYEDQVKVIADMIRMKLWRARYSSNEFWKIARGWGIKRAKWLAGGYGDNDSYKSSQWYKDAKAEIEKENSG